MNLFLKKKSLPAEKELNFRRVKMFKSLFGLVENVVSIAAAPVEIALDVATAVIKPIAEAAQEVVEAIKEDLQ